MKLKTKLIPILTVASTAAIVAPLVTSCAKALAMDDLLLSETSAKPTFAPIQNQDPFESNEEATDKYIEFIKEDPSRWVQDLKWGVYQNWMSFYDDASYGNAAGAWAYGSYKARLLTLECGATEPTFGKVNIAKPSSRDVEYNTISFKMKVHVVAMVDTIDPTTTGVYITKKIDTTIETEYRDMIFFAYPASTDVKSYPAYEDGEKIVTGNPNAIKTGWFITISDNSTDQEKYKWYTEKDWGIKYDSSMTIETTQTDITTQQKTRTVDKANFKGDINKYENFNSLVNLKNYKLDESALAWYNQDPSAILANALLLDVITYYYSSVAIVPSVKAEENLHGVINYALGSRTDPQFTAVSLKGWGFQDSNITSAQSGLTISEIELAPYVDGERASDDITLNEQNYTAAVHDGDPRTLTLHLGKKVASDYIDGAYDQGGVIPLKIASDLNESFNQESALHIAGDEYLYSDMTFALPRNLKIKLTITFTTESQHEPITSWIDFADHSEISVGLPDQAQVAR